jgi:mxaA protein
MTERRRPQVLMLAACMALALTWAAAGTAADERVIEQLDIRQPRTFGYHIGDKFTRIVSLQLRAPYALSSQALPAAGRLSEWLALETPQVTVEQRPQATHYEIRFTYQVVNVGSEAASIAVPHHELLYGDNKESLKALIPATRISVAPLRGSTDNDTQPAQAPTPLGFDTRRPWFFAVALCVSALLLAYLHGGLPWSRSARPFRVAHTTLRAAARRGWQEQDYEAALRAVHRAFNETAGRTVFCDTLPAFFVEHAAFTAMREPVKEFYTRSRDYFFSASNAASAPRYSAQELTALVRRCCDLERGAR